MNWIALVCMLASYAVGVWFGVRLYKPLYRECRSTLRVLIEKCERENRAPGIRKNLRDVLIWGRSRLRYFDRVAKVDDVPTAPMTGFVGPFYDDDEHE